MNIVALCGRVIFVVIHTYAWNAPPSSSPSAAAPPPWVQVRVALIVPEELEPGQPRPILRRTGLKVPKEVGAHRMAAASTGFCRSAELSAQASTTQFAEASRLDVTILTVADAGYPVTARVDYQWQEDSGRRKLRVPDVVTIMQSEDQLAVRSSDRKNVLVIEWKELAEPKDSADESPATRPASADGHGRLYLVLLDLESEHPDPSRVRGLLANQVLSVPQWMSFEIELKDGLRQKREANYVKERPGDFLPSIFEEHVVHFTPRLHDSDWRMDVDYVVRRGDAKLFEITTAIELSTGSVGPFIRSQDGRFVVVFWWRPQ